MMFDMEKVGNNIAKLRKENDMTQLELADSLGISFQAVSNWERGKSMPDIEKLPELAKIFGVAIDQLLGEHSQVIESAVKGNIGECLENGTINIDDVCDVSCMLKASQIAVIAKSERVADIPDFKKLLPFLSSDVVNSLAMEAAENQKYHDLSILAPFASMHIIDDIARKMITEGENITQIAPFISKDAIGEIAEVLYQEHGIKALNNIAPFMQKEQILRLVEKDYAISGQYCWELIMPFIDRKDINDFIQKLIRKDRKS